MEACCLVRPAPWLQQLWPSGNAGPAEHSWRWWGCLWPPRLRFSGGRTHLLLLPQIQQSSWKRQNVSKCEQQIVIIPDFSKSTIPWECEDVKDKFLHLYAVGFTRFDLIATCVYIGHFLDCNMLFQLTFKFPVVQRKRKTVLRSKDIFTGHWTSATVPSNMTVSFSQRPNYSCLCSPLTI